MGWHRARQPAQKEKRRRDILDAAARLFDAGGLDGASLTAIGREAGLSKANLYRYFGSREAILLALLREEQDVWVSALEAGLAQLGASPSVEAVATRVAEVLHAHPRMCALLPVAPTVLESNVSIETVAEFKRAAAHVILRVVNALHAAIPELTPEDARTVMWASMLAVGPAWTHAHPHPVVAELSQRAEFAWLQADFQEMVSTHLRIILRGVLAERATSGPPP